MPSTKPSSASILTVLLLYLISCFITVWLFHYLTEPSRRSETFAFTLAFVCFLEFLSFGYFIPPMLSRFRNTVSFAVYPAIGVVISLYVLVSVAVVIDYNLLSWLLHSLKSYYTALTLDSLLFVIIVGSVLIVNAYKKSEDVEIESERVRRSTNIVTIQQTFDKLIRQKHHFEPKNYQSLESNLKKLKERFDFCTPFGRPNVQSLETEIYDSITNINQILDSAPSLPAEQRTASLSNLDNIISFAIQTIDRRERLLIK